MQSPRALLHHNVSESICAARVCSSKSRRAPCASLTDSPPKPKGGREGYACSGDLFPPLPLWPKKEGPGDLSFSPLYISFLLFPFDFCFTGCILSLLMFLPSFLSSIPTLNPVPSGLSSPSYPNLQTPPLRSSSRPTGPSCHRVELWVHVALSLSAFQVSVCDLLFAPYPVTG